jgi:hypothetical protein
MESYIVNKNAQSNGDHEVHKYPETKCTSPRYPIAENQEYLGKFSGCAGAVAEAKSRGYKTADGCYYCSNKCHGS